MPDDPDEPARYALPLPSPLDPAHARTFAREQVDLLDRVVARSEGAVRKVGTTRDLQACREDGVLGAVLHLEGAEPIAPDLSDLDAWRERGLRSIGPVWSRANAFATGVPFRFPGHPDVGPGLTEAGRNLLARCDREGLLFDLSHLNAAGFNDVARLSPRPLVATHSGAHALSASPRNLTDAQLDAIGASGGLVGVNFHVGFARADGRVDLTTPLTVVVDHVRYIADRIGIEHVALGSDFDGATMPTDLPDAAALPALLDALRRAGFSASDLERIAWGNWLRVLGDVWG